MSKSALTPEQEAEAQRLAEIIGRKAQEEALRMARVLVSKSDAEIFGQTEYELRDSAHRVAAHALETALRERKKGGTRGRA
jgi:hypothetical protein